MHSPIGSTTTRVLTRAASFLPELRPSLTLPSQKPTASSFPTPRDPRSLGRSVAPSLP